MAEALVAGGGPAGATAARLLALWGHDVRLLSPGFAGPADLAESLPPSCQKLFDVIGVASNIHNAGFIRSTGNTVWWGDQETRDEHFPGGQLGWQITRRALAAVLLDAARAAGARIENRRITAEDLARAPESIVLDCTGRTGVIARARGWRRYEPGLRTIALVGLWQHGEEGGRARDWHIPDQTHTLIESYQDGWMWSVPAAGGSRYVAAMVDPRATELVPGGARAVYLAEIAKTKRFAALLHDAHLKDAPSGWDASMYASERYADGRVLLVGDAGSFIDPLSSAGVKKALASGWLAAVAAHTALLRPAMRETAFAFFEAREREIYEHFLALTRRFLTDAASAHAHPFWSDRVGWIEANPRLEQRDRQAIETAFEQIRLAPRLALRRGSGVRIEQRAAVNGREIVMEPWIVGESRQPARYLHDVDLVALIELAPRFEDAGALFNAYVRTRAPVALPDFLSALAAAVANGWLTWRD